MPHGAARYARKFRAKQIRAPSVVKSGCVRAYASLHMGDSDLVAQLEALGATNHGIHATIRPLSDDTQVDFTDAQTMILPRTSRDLPAVVLDLPGEESGEGADLEVRELLGEGGMGRVFLARQHSLDRQVAVKTAKDKAPKAIHDALLFEGVVTGRLEHPAIVPVHALGLDQSKRPTLVMKRIEGVSWDTLLEDPYHEGWEGWDDDPNDRLPGHLQILTQVCNAVHFAHSRGIVHRDVKPENVLIGRFGDVYVADWGIAGRIGNEDDQRLCGTAGYMAPEMAKRGPIDARTDVYLLGAVLHEILTGEQRHEAPTALAAIHLAMASEPFDYDDSTPVDLGALANRSCSLDPAKRPRSALEFRDALASHSEHRASARLTDEAWERLNQLQALLDGTQYRETRREADRLAAEARFGFEQALKSWANNARAEAGLSQLETLLEERRAQAAEFERVAREHDPTIGDRWRRIGLAMVAIFCVILAWLSWEDHQPATAELLVLHVCILGVCVCIGPFLVREHVFRNAFSKRAIGTVIFGTAAMFIPRIADLWGNFDPAHALTRDIFAIAAVSAVGGLTLFRWVYALSAILTIGGVCIIWWPEHALQIFTTSLAVGFVVASILSFWLGNSSRTDVSSHEQRV